ncbi:MAG: glycosyltransferase [Herminiimonas sp.]|nr:glycosyltransferase [Herminiimonas sp.]
MRIAAVVVTHNRPALLRQVIAALQAQTRRPDVIYIVDNASRTETQALLARMRDVVVLRSEVNLGGTGGFALGMERARAGGCDWIWLLDDDAIPRAQGLETLEQALLDLPSTTGAICGTVREFDDIALMHRRRFTNFLGIERCLPREAYETRSVEIDTGSFVGFLASTAAIEAVGLPDTTFFLAYDDTEYSLRLKRAGFDLWLVPDSIVDHMRTAEGRLRSTTFDRKHYFNIRNRIVVKKKYAAFNTVSALSGCLFGIALWMRSKGRFRLHTLRILIRALADGYNTRLGGYPPSLIRLEVKRYPRPVAPVI